MSGTAFPQGKFLLPNGEVSLSWRNLLMNIWKASAQADPTLLVPTPTTVNGHPLTANVTVTNGDVGLGNVTNDAQTKASVMPNTLPIAGQVPVGNGAAYVPQSVSGDAALTSAGALTVSKIGGKAVNLVGALTTVGAFASTFTMTGTTAVTFPASGTLAAIAGTTAGGGTVTQATDKSTAVTLNGATGKITTAASALAAGAIASFQLNNTSIAAPDLVLVQLQGGGATTATYKVWTEASGAGSVVIDIQNISGGSLSEALVISFAVIKSVTA
jgi:hypothetical protein